MRRLPVAAARGFCSPAAGPLWTRACQSAGREEAAAVSGAAFTELLRKTGLSINQLRALYPVHGGARCLLKLASSSAFLAPVLTAGCSTNRQASRRETASSRWPWRSRAAATAWR